MKKLSIITVTYNCKADLSQTLRSIHEQTFTDYEHIIVDGGSTDGTVDVIRQNESRIGKWISEKDKGIYDAMNKGIALATGQYLQFLNAGDVFFGPDSLQQAADKMDGVQDVIFGEIILTDKKGEQVYHIKPLGFDLETLKNRGTASVNHQSFFIKRDITPRYSSRYRLKGELNWYIQIAKTHPTLKAQSIPNPLIRYKLGGAGNIHYLENLKEWIMITYREFGITQVAKNYPRYKGYLAYVNRIKKYF